MLFYNAIRTPDGTVIESTHGHDFRSHTDENGFTYSVDGGRDYARRLTTPGAPAYEELSVADDGDLHKARVFLKWGSYGKEGRSKLHFIAIADMETEHIEAVLDTVPYICPQYKKYMKLELDYRESGSVQ